MRQTCELQISKMLDHAPPLSEFVQNLFGVGWTAVSLVALRSFFMNCVSGVEPTQS